MDKGPIWQPGSGEKACNLCQNSSLLTGIKCTPNTLTHTHSYRTQHTLTHTLTLHTHSHTLPVQAAGWIVSLLFRTLP